MNEFPSSKDDMICPLDERSLNHSSSFQLRESQARTRDCVGGRFEVSMFPLYKVSIAVSRREMEYLDIEAMISLLGWKYEL
jgi:hypothetical protein